MADERENGIYPVMYIFVNKALGMSPGKLAAQASHAAVEAYISSKPDLQKSWRLPEKHYTKLIMEARDAIHLETIKTYLKERGINSELIIDEGYTEILPHQMTALGVEIIDKNELGKVFASFKLFRPELTINLKWS